MARPSTLNDGLENIVGFGLGDLELCEEFGEQEKLSQLVSSFPELARMVDDESIDFSESLGESRLSQLIPPVSRFRAAGTRPLSAVSVLICRRVNGPRR